MMMNFNITFKNLDARRIGMVRSQVNINNNSTIVAASKEGDKLSIGFVFSSTYEPNIGIIRIEGDLTVDESPENIEKALGEWEKSGKTKLPKEMAESIHNTILTNCIVEASFLARDVKLPSPIPMPQVSLNEKESDTSYIR
ncbi:MAG: hypothetical protein V1875_00990 [Candidatus Altiarchaeota archaeon]